MFLLTLFCRWWYELYKIRKMEYEFNLDGWLEEATLYTNEPSDYSLNFDLLPQEKTNNAVVGVTEFIDLPWFDEKVELPFPDDIKNVQLSETDLKEFLSLISSNSDNSHLSSEIPNSSFYDLNFNFDLQGQASSPASSSDFTYSPEYEPISEASSPAQFAFSSECETFSEANSPTSLTSDSEFTYSSELGLSPERSLSASSTDVKCKDLKPAVVVTVCDLGDNVASDQPTESLSIEEVSNSVRKRKFLNNGKEIAKVQVSLKNSFHPYSKSASKQGGDKSERKKVQNKEAAARYRIKKRTEEKELSGEVAGLEAEQAKLKAKHDDLETEIKYLKKLMREMLQKKGIL